jgi:hypothetical protein
MKRGTVNRPAASPEADNLASVREKEVRKGRERRLPRRYQIPEGWIGDVAVVL